MKKVVAFFLVITMFVLGSFATYAYNPGLDDNDFSVDELFGAFSVDFEDVTITEGGYAEVQLKTVNNPGFTKAVVTLDIQSGIAVDSVVAAAGFTAVIEGNTITVTATQTGSTDGVIATVKFASTVGTVGKFKVSMALVAVYGTSELKTAATDAYITVEESSFDGTGDVNGDGVLNTTDLALLKKVVANLCDKSEVPYGDVNGDGVVNTTDLAITKKLIAGL